MAVKIDLRKIFRAIGTTIQEQNLERLLGAIAVNGEPVEPKSNPDGELDGLVGLHDLGAAPSGTPKARPAQTKKRIRLHGVRVKLAQLAGRLGVATGEMLKDVTRKANIKVGRTSVKVTPSGDVRQKWFAFNAGTKHQVARPVSGMTDELVKQSSEDLLRETREQLVRKINEQKKRPT